jgi:hypothetical protein
VDAEGGLGAPAEQAKPWPQKPSRGPQHAPLPLLQRGALHIDGVHWLVAHDALPSRTYLLRGASRLPCGVAQRVRDVLLPAGDAPLPSLT